MSFAGASSTDDVFGVVDNGVGTITLNRPERRNAMSTAMIEGIAELMLAMETSDEVGAIVLTGAGKAFCSGGDVQEFNVQGGEGRGSDVVDIRLVAEQQRQQKETVERIYRCPKPVLASLPGAAAGAGLGFAFAADLRIGGRHTVMATAFGAVGLSGDYGVAWLLAQLVGPAKAREMMFLSTRVDAQECLDLGLVNWIVDDADLIDRTRDIAERLANGPRLALRHMKQNLLAANHVDLKSSMDAEVPLHKAAGLTLDHIDAVRAFVDKRQPVFGRKA